MKKVIIVGASSGIGREVARCLIRDGWQVGLMARRTEPLCQLCSIAPERICYSPCDVCQPDAEERLLALVQQMGGIDLYFHVAGIGAQNPNLLAPTEMSTFDTNVMGFARLVGAVFRYMASQGGGHIAVISSIAGVKGLGPAPSYSASKACQNTYIQALEQLAHSRQLPIRFTDIRPGFVDTPLIAGSRFPMQMRPDRVAQNIVRAIRHGRHVVVIDYRYRVLVFLWRLLPAWIWRRLRLVR